jgi:hypothetical protein
MKEFRMRSISRIAGLFGLSLLVAPALPAQAPPNLSGTWELQVDKSDFGALPGPSQRTDVIDHQEPRITVKRSGASAQGNFTADLLFVVDGKPHKNVVNGNELSTTLRWEGPVLVLVTVTQTDNGEATLTDRWSLSADGKTLTQARTIEVQGQTFDQTAVFAKQ